MRAFGSLRAARSTTGLRARRSQIAKALLVVILLVWPVVYGSSYAMTIMVSAGIFAILTMSVMIILGQAGQLSFGHSAFFGIGAYVSGLMAMKLDLPTLLCLVIGAIVSGVVAFVVGRPVLKLKYFYLALATIGLGQIFLVIVIQVRGVTGGALGFAPVPSLSIAGFEFGSRMRQYYLVWVVAIVILLFVNRALRYRMGRTLRAIATSEIASSTLGIRTANWKLLAFVTSAVLCGLTGGLYAFTTIAVSPDAFTFTAAVIPIIMMLLGGGTSAWGCILGAIVMTWVVKGFTGAQQYSGVSYTIVMLLLLMFLPAGLALSPAQRAKVRSGLMRLSGRGRAGVPQGDEEMALHPTAGLDYLLAGRERGAPASACAQVPGPTPARAVPDSSQPLLRVENTSVHFGGLAALADVCLEVPEGQITALIGPNGAGKTTLFNVISRLQRADAGSLWFAGADITKKTAADVARLGMARTFQNLRIYPNMTVLENVLVGCHRHERSALFGGGLGLPRQRSEEQGSRERARAALATLDLEHLAEAPAASLPYGSQRLVEIARALASAPRLLLLDEPAAGMNASERAHLVGMIRRIHASGVTILLVEHDIELVLGISDGVCVLDYGKLICSGCPETVREDPRVVEAYLGVKRDSRKDFCTVSASGGPESAEPEALLSIRNLSTNYGAIRALQGVTFDVPKGQVVAVLGANGAGKTTLLRTVSGLLRPSEGQIVYDGREIARLSAEVITSRGLRQVPEGRRLFAPLSVQDNLVLGSCGRRGWRQTLDDDIAFVYEIFPILADRRRQLAGTLSGGEQQMLAIGRALVGRPTLLLLDEPSMGLAPLAAERIFEALAGLNKQGLTMLLVEQSAEIALSLAHRAVVLRTGCVVLSETSDQLRQDDRVRAGYLGDAQSVTLSGK
jgi:ABC-type branched-subunit amino acid transport system ATPase component/ABC-type branched-subunit amino acid transport system permease subunit